ncbi:MAG: penicillin-binding transpeptidase domain-containing protein, partial [Candidatus Binatota bacterium]|nr:penicillin-binding transpeptidase domain-containing protein [Candidatus Binatota bacterium]
VRARSVAVKHVMDQNTKVLEKRDVKLEQVLSPSLAYTMNQLLKGVMDRGTGAQARRWGFTRPAAGKTGTTNDYKDAWFVGYTPELLAVVWVGYDGPAKTGLSGAEAALPIWTEFMKAATASMPVTDFVPPPALRNETPEGTPAEKCGPLTREGEPPGEPCPAPAKPAEPA